MQKSIPTEYQGLNRDTIRLKQCIVEDIHGGFYIFDKPEAQHIKKEAVHKIWPNFDAFEKENKQTLLTYHENLFKKPAAKDQALIETASWIWYKIISVAVDRTERTPVTAAGRVSTLLGRKYFHGKDTTGTGEIKTSQALACIRLFRRCMTEQGIKSGEPGKETTHVTEEILKTFVTENAAELKTRQEPWRIFQYYRPQLIKAGILRYE